MTKEIAALNDTFRENAIRMPQRGWLLVSPAINSDPKLLEECLKKTLEFNTFTEEDDPYGEHDFGCFTINNVDYFWKIEEPEVPGSKMLFIIPASEY